MWTLQVSRYCILALQSSTAIFVAAGTVSDLEALLIHRCTQYTADLCHTHQSCNLIFYIQKFRRIPTLFIWFCLQALKFGGSDTTSHIFIRRRHNSLEQNRQIITMCWDILWLCIHYWRSYKWLKYSLHLILSVRGSTLDVRIWRL